ncbi:MAG: hypothetical protein M3P83_05350 [Actinomycetota bacterium]|nr:hypothetical protein [Actinomycetota bacterium]
MFEHRHRWVLTQRAIEGGNEIVAFAATLNTLPDLRGTLVTADALHTQREHATYLHGRTETRSIAVLAADGAPGIDGLFPLTAQVMRVIRTRTDRKSGKRSREVVHAITCLDHRCADPGLLAGWLQDHWGKENRVHHVRDVTLTVRTPPGSAPAPGRS